MPLRYAVLHHGDVDPPHFDLLLETLPGSMLATWRLPAWPADEPAPATRLRDHRRLYLEFEGDIPGGRGFVTRVADGTCDLEIAGAGLWIVEILTGSTPRTFRLRQMDSEQWQFEPA